MEPGRGAIRLIVDGEQFAVEANPDHPGQYQFAWLSGPNLGYGFATATSNGSSLSQTQMEAAIRNFLHQIDPATGYIA